MNGSSPLTQLQSPTELISFFDRPAQREAQRLLSEALGETSHG